MNDFKISKFMSYILRHDPKDKLISKEGWMDIKDLLSLLNERFSNKINLRDLERIVRENNKKRFKIEGNKIRASQGHSNKSIDLGLVSMNPPEILYHGTKKSILEAIKSEGLKKMDRHHVHLSADKKTAEIVAKRWNQEMLILTIDAKAMNEDGHEFYFSDNGVWLTDNVPPQYIKILLIK
ncbi:MAG: RNA 2'-phosphotransferase [Candidatus Lokiarchaeota archaeon]|nr:RNA 2'-phosphotransferase [Candidatus Lokiarchaeota archaeon]